MRRTPQPATNTSTEVPSHVAVSATGTVSAVPPPAATETIRPTGEVLSENLHTMGTAFANPAKEDELVQSFEHLGQLTELRIGADPAQQPASRPVNAATHLEGATVSMIDTLRTSPVLPQLLPRLSPEELEGRLKKLRFLRRLYKAVAPIVRTLDIAIANLEQGLDTDLRDAYKQIRSLLPYNPRLADSLAAVTELITAPATKAVATRFKNSRKRGADAPAPVAPGTPAPSTLPTTPVTGTTATPAQPVPTPLPPFTLPQTAPAPRRRSRTTRR